MEANVYRSASGWMVSLRVRGRKVDEAGPFEEEIEAVMAGRRCVALSTPCSEMEAP